jgi:hypothetical protein
LTNGLTLFNVSNNNCNHSSTPVTGWCFFSFFKFKLSKVALPFKKKENPMRLLHMSSRDVADSLRFQRKKWLCCAVELLALSCQVFAKELPPA